MRHRVPGADDLVQSSGDSVYLASDASSCKMKLYVLQQDVTTATKKARAMCFDADVFNTLTFTEEIGSLKESFVNDKIIEMTENEFLIINLTRSVMLNQSWGLPHSDRISSVW